MVTGKQINNEHKEDTLHDFHRARLKPTINVFIRQDKISLTSTQFIGIIIDDERTKMDRTHSIC